VSLVASADASVTPYDLVGRLSASEFNSYIIGGFGTNGWRDWGREPSIAVNPLDPNKMVVATFAYGRNPIDLSYAGQASLWYTTNAGVSWGLRFPITQVASAPVGPRDQTIQYDSKGILHMAILLSATYSADGAGTGFGIFHGQASDPDSDGGDGRSTNLWQWTNGGTQINAPSNDPDQPWLAVGPIIGDASGVAVHVGHSNFDTFLEERVASSTNGGTSFRPADDRRINNGMQQVGIANPGTRIAMDREGRVYSLFGWPASDLGGGLKHVQYSLNRWSGADTWDFTTNNAQPGGITVDQGNSLQGYGYKFGDVNALLGNITSIAASPDAQHIYTVYGKQDASNIDQIYVREFHPDPNNPTNLLGTASVAVSQGSLPSALPSAAVTDDGKLWIMYDQFDPADATFSVQLASSTDGGQSFEHELLYSFTSPIPDNGDARQRVLGDYQGLIALGNRVYGTFAGRGNVSNGVIQTSAFIDPFVFSAPGPPPVLTIQLTSTNTLVVAWPTSSTGFSLQQNSSLGSTNWLSVTNIPIIMGSDKQVTIPALGERMFYRLAQ
jgi:hypothetical protein